MDRFLRETFNNSLPSFTISLPSSYNSISSSISRLSSRHFTSCTSTITTRTITSKAIELSTLSNTDNHLRFNDDQLQGKVDTTSNARFVRSPATKASARSDSKLRDQEAANFWQVNKYGQAIQVCHVSQLRAMSSKHCLIKTKLQLQPKALCVHCSATQRTARPLQIER